MYNLEIERTRHQNTLYLNVWCEDTLNIHTEWPILFLHNSELDFLNGSRGGRFHHFDPALRTNKVEMRVGFDLKLKSFSTLLEWMCEQIQSDWSFDITPDKPISIGGGFGLRTVAYTLNLYFASDDDAVLVKLKFA